MSKICYICNKQSESGHNVSHSKRRTKRTWSPNLGTANITENGYTKKVAVCTRCLKTLAKQSA